jgi:hypothetical protein
VENVYVYKTNDGEKEESSTPPAAAYCIHTRQMKGLKALLPFQRSTLIGCFSNNPTNASQFIDRENRNDQVSRK